MATTTLDDFVRCERHSAQVLDEQSVEWHAEKTEWLAYLDGLYAKVSEFLGSYVDQGQVSIVYEKVALHEELIGPCAAKAMTIRIGSKVVQLEPIGTNLIGSRGRVEVSGPLGSARLLLLRKAVTSASDLVQVTVSFSGLLPPRSARRLDSAPDWTWKIVSRPPARSFVDLDKETFLNLLLEVSNG